MYFSFIFTDNQVSTTQELYRILQLKFQVALNSHDGLKWPWQGPKYTRKASLNLSQEGCSSEKIYSFHEKSPKTFF